MNPLTYPPEREAEIRKFKPFGTWDLDDYMSAVDDLLAELDETRKRLADEWNRCLDQVRASIEAYPHDGMDEGIGKAIDKIIATERERCAIVADVYANNICFERAKRTADADTSCATAREIAAAIRRGE